MSQQEIRVKEATVQLTVDGVRQRGSMLTIYDVTIRPEATIEKTRYPGEDRQRADLDIMGVEVSFKTRKRDHLWADLWNRIQAAEGNGDALPDVSMVVTYAYRGGTPRSVSLHGDGVLKMDDTGVPESGYLNDSWSGYFSFMTTI